MMKDDSPAGGLFWVLQFVYAAFDSTDIFLQYFCSGSALLTVCVFTVIRPMGARALPANWSPVD